MISNYTTKGGFCMSEVFATPVVAMNLTVDGVNYYMEVGAAIDKLVMAAGPEDVELKGTLAAISLAMKSSQNTKYFGTVYDGIPTYQYATDNLAAIRNAADYFKVDKILMEVPAEEEGKDPTFVAVPVSRIKSIQGTFTAPDGTVTTSVDLTQEGTSVSAALEEIPEAGGTVVLTAGEIAEELTVTTAATLSGVNAGVAQNFVQEV